MSKKAKISSTAYRVLLLMQLLNRQDCSIDNLNDIFSSNSNIARSFSKEVIVKYINTLRSAGYKVSKPNPLNNHSYRLIKAPVIINFNKENLQTLAEIEGYIMSLYQVKLQKNYINLVEKISRFLSEEQIAILNNARKNNNNVKKLCSRYLQYADLIKKFEQYCIEDQRIVVKYRLPLDKEEKHIILEPKSIKYEMNDVYISGYNSITSEKQLLHLKNIEEIKQLPTKSKYSYVLSPIIFKLKGRVAKGYRLYEDEKIVGSDPDDGNIKIAAYVDDKNMLFQRLLKYGDYCEVIYPKAARDSMIDLVKNALGNYGGVKF